MRSKWQLRHFILAAALFALGVATAVQADDAGYRVVVNVANPAGSMEKSDVARMFLKKLTRWPNGEAARPIDLPDTSRVRERFTKGVLGKPVSAITAYWQQQIFAGREVPPLTKASEAEVLAYVKANPTAIGYLAPESVSGDVKVLTIR